MGLIGIMIGASYTHLTHNEASQMWRPIAFAVLLVIIVLLSKPWPMKSDPQQEGRAPQ